MVETGAVFIKTAGKYATLLLQVSLTVVCFCPQYGHDLLYATISVSVNNNFACLSVNTFPVCPRDIICFIAISAKH